MADLVHLVHSGTVVLGSAAPVGRLVLACITHLSGCDVGLILEVDEVEQLVLYDGTADGETGCVEERLTEGEVVGITSVVAFMAETGAGQLVAGEVIVNAGVQLVGAAFSHGVDVAAGEAALAHIERRNADADGLKGVEGDRGAACWQVAADAVCVMERGAVDGDVRLAEVASSDGQTE